MKGTRAQPTKRTKAQINRMLKLFDETGIDLDTALWDHVLPAYEIEDLVAALPDAWFTVIMKALEQECSAQKRQSAAEQELCAHCEEPLTEQSREVCEGCGAIGHGACLQEHTYDGYCDGSLQDEEDEEE